MEMAKRRDEGPRALAAGRCCVGIEETQQVVWRADVEVHPLEVPSKKIDKQVLSDISQINFNSQSGIVTNES